MLRKPRVFIGSAVESRHVANAIGVSLDRTTEPSVWRHGFRIAQNTIERLLKMAHLMDFAVFFFSPRDVSMLHRKNQRVVRDNVVFNLGLFAGALGKERCFVVKPRNVNLFLPTDLLGLTPADYDGGRSDKDLVAAVNTPCALIKDRIDELGLFSGELAIGQKAGPPVEFDFQLGDVEHRLLSSVLNETSGYAAGSRFCNAASRLSDVPEGVLSIAMAKLERLGYVTKSVSDEDRYEVFVYAITADGIDYVLENEDLVIGALKSAPKREFNPYDDDDDVPF